MWITVFYKKNYFRLSLYYTGDNPDQYKHMPRHARIDIAGEIYHVINRANAKSWIFESSGDRTAVIESMGETLQKVPIDIFAFCIMSNHWHFAVRPRADGDMGKFFGKFTQKVTQRWHKFHQTVGSGHLFQGRFKTFLVQTDPYFIQLMKYIEANPLRAGLVSKAEDWAWCSLSLRQENIELANTILTPWPIDIPAGYIDMVNQPMPKVFLEQVRGSVMRGRPFGDNRWVEEKISEYGLEHTIRQPFRPQKLK